MDTQAAGPRQPRDATNWAAKVDRLHVDEAVREHGYNIEGRRVAGPQQGFGRLWQRIYTADLGTAVTPERLVADWRAHFGEYWPKVGRFYGSVSAIQPGDVAPLASGPMATGVLVLYADETSFSFLTPEGHMFASMITFSGETALEGSTVATIRILLRCSDPLFEAAWPALRRGEDYFWPHTLRNLGAAHGVHGIHVAEDTECLDRRRLWKNWTNVRYNSGIRSGVHLLTTPFRPRRRTGPAA